MDFETKMNSAYKSELTFLSIMTVIFGFVNLFLGYLILPLAAGFYAALLLFEKKENRVLSYIIPLALLVINVFINGFYSVEAISYVIVGAIIFVGFDKKKNKAFTFFFATAALIVLMTFSLMLFAFDRVGTFKISALNEFYLSVYESGKDMFVTFLTSFKTVDEEGFVFHNYNPSEAVEIYNAFVYSLIPFSIIFALIVVGLASKLLCSRVRKFNFKDERVNEWLFVTSPFLACKTPSQYHANVPRASIVKQSAINSKLAIMTFLEKTFFIVNLSYAD